MMADYIRREDARRMVVQLDKYAWKSPVSDERRVTVDVDLVKFGLDRIPAADVAPVRHGHWIGEGDGYADGALVYDVWHCSECDYCIDDGTDAPELLPKFCPNCGAKMDGGDGSAAD